MAVETENITLATPEEPMSESARRLRAQIDAMRARGHQPIRFRPIRVKGEPVSVTIIRERRGDFDDDPLS